MPCPISMTPLLPATTSQQINSTQMTTPSAHTPSDICFSLLLPSTCQNIKKSHHQHHALHSWSNPRAGCPCSACLGTVCLVLHSVIWSIITLTHPLLAPLLLPTSCATIVIGSPKILLQAHWLTKYTAPSAPLEVCPLLKLFPPKQSHWYLHVSLYKPLHHLWHGAQ